MAMSGFAQTDSTRQEKVDTVRIGGIIIVRKGDKNDTTKKNTVDVQFNKKKKSSNLSTNWWIVDLGFANFHDQTNYASAAAQQFAPGSTEDWFKLRTGKSVNVNIWVFMQRLNLIKNVVNLKYGLGVELNNYRFDQETIVFQENPTLVRMNQELKGIKKNKLAADYLTVPMMLNFNFTPKRSRGFGLSTGVSAGYLYSSRQKFKDNDDKDKTHDDFNLNKWKLSYIGELSLGPVRLYGSYAFKSMWEKGLDQTPYNVGVRFSHW